MILKEMIEVIQQHHPEMNETMIMKSINRAQDDFSAKTSIIHAIATDTILKDKRLYALDPSMLSIKRVEIDSVAIDRMLSMPLEGDID